MRTAAMKEMVNLSKSGSGSLGAIVNAAIEDDNVVSSILETKLKEAGYNVEYTPRKHTVEVHVFKGSAETEDYELIAYGLSNTNSDALRQAMYAVVREENKTAEAAQQPNDQQQ